MKTQMESLIYHLKIVTEGYRVPAGEAYQCIEAPRGEIGYYVVSDGTSKPYRVHMRTPSFGNLQGLPTMLENTMIADSIAALGSMDFVLGDTDPVMITFSPKLEEKFARCSPLTRKGKKRLKP